MATIWAKRGNRSGQATQATTEAAPTGNMGVDLDQVESVAVAIHAPAGQTFDGTGSFLGYRQILSDWVRAPRADVDMADYAGLSDAAPPAVEVQAPTGRFIFIPSGVGLSGGSSIVTDYECTLRTGAPA